MRQLTISCLVNTNSTENKSTSYKIPKIMIFVLSLLIYLSFFIGNTTCILISLGIVSIIISIRPIDFGVPLYWIFCFSTQYYTYSHFSAARVLGLALFVGLLLRAFRNKTYKKLIKEQIILLIITVYTGASVLYSLVPILAFEEYFTLMINIAILIAFNLNRIDLHKINKLIYYATVYSIFFIILLVLIKGNLMEGLTLGALSRVSMDNSQNPGEFGRNMVLNFAILLFTVSDIANKNKEICKLIVTIIAVIIAILLIIISGSRSSLIGACVIAFLYIVQDVGKGTRKLGQIIILLMVLCCIFFILFYASSSIEAILNRYTVDNVMATHGARRFDIWKLYINYVIPNNILFGVGVGGSSEMAALLQTGKAISIYLKPAHNMYLQLVIEFGIIGFILFISFFLQLFKQFFFLPKEIKALKYRYFVIFIALLIMAIGEPMFYSKIFWIIVMLIMNRGNKNIKDVFQL